MRPAGRKLTDKTIHRSPIIGKRQRCNLPPEGAKIVEILRFQKTRNEKYGRTFLDSFEYFDASRSKQKNCLEKVSCIIYLTVEVNGPDTNGIYKKLERFLKDNMNGYLSSAGTLC